MQFSSDSNAVTSSSSQMASLPSSPIESILPTATPSIAGTKRGPVPKRRFQKGTFVKRRGNWVGMWRVETMQPDGTTKREQRSETFIGLSERAARAALQPILDAVNAANHATPPVPKTSDTVAKAVAEWREHAAVTLKPSSRRSAESHLRRHILPEKKLRPLLVSLGIPPAGFHAFRHGVATTLIDQGASITTVGAQLRHSDPRITLGLYAHVVPQSQRDAVEGLASTLSSGHLLTQRLNADSV